MSISSSYFQVLFVAVLVTVGASGAAFARDAAFINPGGISEEAVRVDPKAEIDVGETAINVSKRSSIFFVNETNVAVKIEKVVINSDSDVTAEETANDCTKQGSIAPLSRCSVQVSVTPTSPGTWSVDVLMTHNGAGRITRARLTGKTSGSGSSDSKSTGLAVNSKEMKPIDFGSVEVGGGKIVRSTLMVNDSSEQITIFAIDVIEADNGLQRLDQGCAVNMELAPGASCPVTLLWVPKSGGPISTDLIIRHSGKLGFAVIPVRGDAKGYGGGGSGEGNAENYKKSAVPMPLSEKDLEKEMAGKVTSISDSSLKGGSMSGSKTGSDGGVHLIGTIGDRALFLLPSGETAVFSVGEKLEAKAGAAKLVAVGAHSAEIMVGGKKKTLQLEAASSLVAQATEQAQEDAAQQKSVSGSGKK